MIASRTGGQHGRSSSKGRGPACTASVSSLQQGLPGRAPACVAPPPGWPREPSAPASAGRRPAACAPGLRERLRRRRQRGQFLGGGGPEEAVEAGGDAEPAGRRIVDLLKLREQLAHSVAHPLGGPPASTPSRSADLVKGQAPPRCWRGQHLRRVPAADRPFRVAFRYVRFCRRRASHRSHRNPQRSFPDGFPVRQVRRVASPPRRRRNPELRARRAARLRWSTPSFASMTRPRTRARAAPCCASAPSACARPR